MAFSHPYNYTSGALIINYKPLNNIGWHTGRLNVLCFACRQSMMWNLGSCPKQMRNQHLVVL